MPTATHERTFKTGVDIPENKRNQIIELLNRRLADSTDLKTQTKYAHWNIKGPNFYQLHELFDEIAEHFDDYSDLLAERATALGGVAHGTVRQAAANSSVQEYDLKAVEGEQHVRALSQRIAVFANAAREAIDQCDDQEDKATADVFTEIVRQADKDLWFLEAHLQAESAGGQLKRAS